MIIRLEVGGICPHQKDVLDRRKRPARPARPDSASTQASSLPDTLGELQPSLWSTVTLFLLLLWQCREVVSLPRLLLQLRCRFRAAMDVLTSDPKVAEFMNTSLGKYLESHPFLTLSLLVFGAMAMVPVSLFLVFVVVTFIAATVGFIFLEVFLLSLGGATLLCVLCGIALVAIVVSSILCAVYITTSNVLNLYYSQRGHGPQQANEGLQEGGWAPLYPSTVTLISAQAELL
ncbi:hypothetical protein JZ751_028759 [Albula glossodonta]|uniref:Promethin n=1 Tax=Albula glossodonta TaxID=121402 RepID=A0A8T2MPA6_9TELE|nr:hypothetical protein JZ751_028759 [Albula glossodonta]